MLKKLILVFVVILLTACLSPVKTAQKNSYVLNMMPPSSGIAKVKTQVLLVSTPRLDAVMDNNKMVYLDGQHQIGYFSVHRWAAKPNDLFFSLLLTTLQQQSAFSAVISGPYNARSDLQLNIVNFSIVQDFTVRPSVVRVKMNASLSNVKKPYVLKTRIIQANVATSVSTPEAGVVAANQAVAQCLTQIVAFVNE